MAEKSLMWLIYRRTRVGIAFAGFILMYAFYTGLFGINMVLVALSVFFAELFGACYNDSQDFKEDVRNNRRDKLTIIRAFTPFQMMFVSIAMLLGSLITALLSGFLLLAVMYLFMAWAYSYPKIRLKSHHIFGYAIIASTWLIIPLYLGFFFRGLVTPADILFSLFFFLQYLYLLSQKDSTDRKDDVNLFIKKGWGGAVEICSILALLSSMMLLALSLPRILLVLIWGLNLSVKIIHIEKIYVRSISRESRSNFTLMEFLTPYICIAGGFFA